MADEWENAVSPAWLRPEALARAERLGLRVKAMVDGLRLGEHASPRQGFASEFSQHRPYTPGDDVRFLDWKVYGRSERFMIRQLRQESNLVAHLVLDASRSMLMGEPNSSSPFDGGTGSSPSLQGGAGGVNHSKLDHARLLAAAVAYVLLQQQDVVRLHIAAPQWRTEMTCDRPDEFLKLAAALESQQPDGQVSWGPLLSSLAARLPPRGMVLFITDGWDDPTALVGGLRQLRLHGHEVTFLHLLHPEERHFPFHGIIRFEGLEGEVPLTLSASDLASAYRQALAVHLETLAEGCAMQGIRYLLADTSRDLGDVLVELLGGS
jgi:uncharacterized protein (DUF58 family)